MLLVIDNYDSFTYNLVQYFGELGERPRVVRNDELTVDAVGALNPDAIVLSPGPGAPAHAGICIPVIRRYGASVPLLGVCLGHQAIGEAYGGTVIRAPRGVMHGKTSRIRHDGTSLFAGLEDPLEVMRYHSLVIEHATIPAELHVTATAADDATEIHAVQHRRHPVWGVQFHPESILTQQGKQLLQNFLHLARGGAGRAVLGTLLAGWAMLSALIAPLQAQEVYSTPTLEGPRATAASAYVVSRMSAGFAGAILVAHHGKVVLRGGYGMANRERGIPWSTSIVAPLGSVTKVFTAAAVVDLWDRKLLAPSDKLGKFFPRFTTASTADLTVQQLLTHTSGLDTFSGDDFEKIGLSEFLTRTLGSAPKSAPGTMRTSNIGFSLLAAIVERVGGLSMDSFLRRRLFNFVGMTHTGYNLPNLPSDSMAVGYLNDIRRGTLIDSLAPLGADFWNLYGNGGMQGSAEELYLWVRALADGKVLSAQGRRAMWAPQARRPDGAEYGYGWSVRRDAKGELEQVSNSGSDGVFLASLNYFPQEDLFVSVVSNVGGRESMISSTISGVLRVMLGGESPPP